MLEKGYSEDDIDNIDNAEVEIILSPEEQHEYYERCMDMLKNNMGWVLDNLDYLPTFRVGWENYRKKIKPFEEK